MYLQVPELPHNTQTAAGQECVLSRKQEVLPQSECSVWPEINPSTSPADSSRRPARSATVGAMHKKLKVIPSECEDLKSLKAWHTATLRPIHQSLNTKQTTVMQAHNSTLTHSIFWCAFITSLKQTNTLLSAAHAQCSCGFGSGAKIPQEEVTHVLGTMMLPLIQIRCTRKRHYFSGNIYVFISLLCTK